MCRLPLVSLLVTSTPTDQPHQYLSMRSSLPLSSSTPVSLSLCASLPLYIPCFLNVPYHQVIWDIVNIARLKDAAGLRSNLQANLNEFRFKKLDTMLHSTLWNNISSANEPRIFIALTVNP